MASSIKYGIQKEKQDVKKILLFLFSKLAEYD